MFGPYLSRAQKLCTPVNRRPVGVRPVPAAALWRQRRRAAGREGEGRAGGAHQAGTVAERLDVGARGLQSQPHQISLESAVHVCRLLDLSRRLPYDE